MLTALFSRIEPLSRLWARHLLAQGRAAEALALMASRCPDALSILLMHRLGMHASVLSTARAIGADGRGLSVVSALAATGQPDAADAVARASLAPLSRRAEVRKAYAHALAATRPQAALAVLGGVDAPGLRAALLIAGGLADEAVHRVAGSVGRAEVEPDMLLLAHNLDGSEDGCRWDLGHLNEYLSRFELDALQLADPTQPLSLGNLASAVKPCSVRGPLASVVMTACDVADRIGYALCSLWRQSYADLEVIVVDDASCDGTPDLVEAMAREDGRLRLVRLGGNVGTYVAKSVGLRLARGEFVTCQDADDWAHPRKIERQIRPLLDNRGIVATSSRWVRMRDDGDFCSRHVYPLTRWNPSSLMFRRSEVLARAGWHDGVRTGADSEFAARLRLVFGRSACADLRLPLTLGAHRAGSLMTDSRTGIGASGFSPERLVYWESWNRWHVETLAAGRLPYLPLLPDERLFAAPASIGVDLRLALAALGLGHEHEHQPRVAIA